MIPDMSASDLDLAPARWIWLPCERTLQNTVVLFRREWSVDASLTSATGWIVADSRYRLLVNGVRAQWGPAASDPRDQEADPLDLLALLRPGRNVLAVEVLYYGTGDGTWPGGSPGLLLRLDLTHADGSGTTLVSDASWQCAIDRAWMPGRYKRWYLRALQEIVDSRLHPSGWDQPGFDATAWPPARELAGAADRPSLCAGASDYQYDAGATAPAARPGAVALRLRRRTIPLLDESVLIDAAVREAGIVHWHRDPDDWFEFRLPGTMSIVRGAAPTGASAGWIVPATAPDEGRFLTLALPEQTLGWPRLEITAPAGAIIEIIVQEGHHPAGPAWLDTAQHRWLRLTCHGGPQTFEAFDFECCRWLQLHVRSPQGPVHIHRLGLRRRRFPWPAVPHLHSAEPALDRLFAAAINTLHNSAHDLVVDGSGRERQQYSGDAGHQLVAIRHLLGEYRLPARFLRTFSEGQTPDGYFLDCWPAYDRLNRLAQRQLGLTCWGPILDHGVQFVLDHQRHYLETGDLEASREAWPRLVRQLDYLARLVAGDGMLPVEDLGVPTVWMDHDGFAQQRHKRCSFNLHVIGMLLDGMVPLATAFAEAAVAARAIVLANGLLAATVAAYWDPVLRLFVDNRPWMTQGEGPRTHDRSLATAVLHALVPGGDTTAISAELSGMPERCGRSYPANAGWRLSALARLDRADAVVRDLRERWAVLPSVLENGTLQEDWGAQPDSTSQWSHCALGAFNAVIQDLIGLRATAPGFAAWILRPRLADLESLDLDAHTVAGCFRVRMTRSASMIIEVPAGCGPGRIELQDGTVRTASAGQRIELVLSGSKAAT